MHISPTKTEWKRVWLTLFHFNVDCPPASVLKHSYDFTQKNSRVHCQLRIFEIDWMLLIKLLINSDLFLVTQRTFHKWRHSHPHMTSHSHCQWCNSHPNVRLQTNIAYDVTHVPLQGFTLTHPVASLTLQFKT